MLICIYKHYQSDGCHYIALVHNIDMLRLLTSILTCRKKLFESVNYFVHLNLAITLLLAFIVFVFGVELGNSTTVSTDIYKDNNTCTDHDHHGLWYYSTSNI